MTASRLAGQMVLLKREFAKRYSGHSHIQEIIPLEIDGVPPEHMSGLHSFAENSPIYYRSYQDTISGVPCMVYEGDINDYWLGSIKNDSSTQPFYPTWIVSAYVLALRAAEMRYEDIIDIGSGDGRIAYCGGLVGSRPHAVEIDSALVDLQKKMIDSTGVDFDPHLADATTFDYDRLELQRAAFFIGGLAQMGGDLLASAILDSVAHVPRTGMIFAGTRAKKYLSSNASFAGWAEIISRYDMKVIDELALPTTWTFDQPDETPYLFAETGSAVGMPI